MASFENHKTEISELYAGNTLPVVRRFMLQTHGFNKTDKQWKTQLKRWGLEKKNLKATEYQAIVRKKRKREEHGKETAFLLDGREVPSRTIQRWMAAHTAEQDYHSMLDIETPPNLVYYTPPNSPKGSVQNIEETEVPRNPSPAAFDWFDTFVRYSSSPIDEFINLPMDQTPSLSLIPDLVKPIGHYEKQMGFQNFMDRMAPGLDCENCTLMTTLFCCERLFVAASDTSLTSKREIVLFACAAMHQAFQIWRAENNMERDERIFRLGMTVHRFSLFRENYERAKVFARTDVPELEVRSAVHYRPLEMVTMIRNNLNFGKLREVEEQLKVMIWWSTK